MRSLRVIVPLLVTAVLTAVCILLAGWLTGLVPAGEWAGLIKAGIVVAVVTGTLLIIAWSAYFTYTIKALVREQ